MSAADRPSASRAFDLLHPRLQKWVWNRGWTDLREIQERAIPHLVDGEASVLLAAATAMGKTEAAFLPILTNLLRYRERGEQEPGIEVVLLSPLKALINDQFERLEGMCRDLSIPVHRWHGDVAASRKAAVRRKPEGVLLITPESVEALFCRHGGEAQALFGRLRFLVVDEIHSFFGTERGRHLQSLLTRLDAAGSGRVPRVGLSATIGDMELAADFLHPGRPEDVVCLEVAGQEQELRAQLKGFLAGPDDEEDSPGRANPESSDDPFSGEPPPLTEGDPVALISRDLFRRLRGGRHLIFANSRRNVERFADYLRKLCEALHLPNEFWPHHGSLAKELREDAERALKEESRPATAIATTTLELGIDLGRVQSIAQIGPPPSVSSLRQRLGRSGRRGEPAILRLYVDEPTLEAGTPPQYRLRTRLTTTIAMLELLLERWFEPPSRSALHLSTLVHQVLSLLAQWGGIRAAQAHTLLCKRGPFRTVDERLFARVLRSLGEADLLGQAHSGELVLGAVGERLVGHYTFYAAFTTPEEYRLTTGGKTLGTLPVLWPLVPGSYLIFAGRRWRIREVLDERKIVDLEPAGGGRTPNFGGMGSAVHDRVRQKMRELYLRTDYPAYLDPTARALLDQGRDEFRRLQLHRRPFLAGGSELVLFPWRGDAALQTLILWIRSLGMEAHQEGVAVILRGTGEEELPALLGELLDGPAPSAVELGAHVQNLHREKFHEYLGAELLLRDYASAFLDVDAARETASELLAAL